METSSDTREKKNTQNLHKSNENSKLFRFEKKEIKGQSLIQKSRVSNIIFKKEFSHSEKEKIIQKVKKIYKEKEWRFNFKEDLNKNDPTTLFENSETIFIEGLTFHFCKNENLIKSLKCVNFPKLRYLCLPGNNIKSWELLNTIDLENLEVMDLRENYLSSCKSLIKANFNKIYSVTLPNILTDGSWELLRRSNFTQSFSQLFIHLDKNANIYPFLFSLMFKEKKWSENESRLIVLGALISSKNEKLIKELVSKRSNIQQIGNWSLSLYDPER